MVYGIISYQYLKINEKVQIAKLVYTEETQMRKRDKEREERERERERRMRDMRKAHGNQFPASGMSAPDCM